MARPRALNSVRRRYWELVADGVPPWVASGLLGVSETTGGPWFVDAGGVKPQISEPKGRKRPRLSIAEREEIMIGTRQGESIRSIARRLGRAPSTIMREIHLNGRCHDAPGRYRALHRFGAKRGGRDAKSGYRAHLAQVRSEARARRPKTGKLAGDPELCATVEGLLGKRYSPEQIAGVLALTYPDRADMQVSHETIYKALYVQGRGGLRRELTQCLRTGRALRKPRGRTAERERRGRIPGMVNIAERPAEADDRAVPGHWESQWCCQAA
jgi:IS30 family transposase